MKFAQARTNNRLGENASRSAITNKGNTWMSWGVLIAKLADAPRMARDTKRATVMSVENIFSDLYKEKARRRGRAQVVEREWVKG